MNKNHLHFINKHKKKKKTGEPYRYPDQIEFDEDLVLNSCSMYDCTGLIPAAPINDAEAESYNEVYNYLGPNAD